MDGGLGLPCLANKQISLNPVRGILGFLTQALCVFLEALTERMRLFKTASLHHGAPFGVLMEAALFGIGGLGPAEFTGKAAYCIRTFHGFGAFAIGAIKLTAEIAHP
jgi:hypothetical protein